MQDDSKNIYSVHCQTNYIKQYGLVSLKHLFYVFRQWRYYSDVTRRSKVYGSIKLHRKSQSFTTEQKVTLLTYIFMTYSKTDMTNRKTQIIFFSNTLMTTQRHTHDLQKATLIMLIAYIKIDMANSKTLMTNRKTLWWQK